MKSQDLRKAAAALEGYATARLVKETEEQLVAVQQQKREAQASLKNVEQEMSALVTELEGAV